MQPAQIAVRMGELIDLRLLPDPENAERHQAEEPGDDARRERRRGPPKAPLPNGCRRFSGMWISSTSTVIAKAKIPSLRRRCGRGPARRRDCNGVSMAAVSSEGERGVDRQKCSRSSTNCDLRSAAWRVVRNILFRRSSHPGKLFGGRAVTASLQPGEGAQHFAAQPWRDLHSIEREIARRPAGAESDWKNGVIAALANW